MRLVKKIQLDIGRWQVIAGLATAATVVGILATVIINKSKR